ncbi:hypothetical protein BKI52_35415 [marine bacterium AO1-C]|nr:hypothetical protein BKI52_35415 [marine bacterium AO1-C]
MKNLFLWNIAPDISESDIRRIKLLNISCVVAMGINLLDFIILYVSGATTLSLGNFFSVIYFFIPLLLSIRRKYVLSQGIFIFSAPVNFFLIYLLYARNMGIHLYMFTLAILAIFIFKKKILIYLALGWIGAFFFVMTISIKYQWFTPLSDIALVWADFFWWNNFIGAIITTMVFASIFRMETFNYESKMQRQNSQLAEQREELQQSFEELQSTQEFLEQKQREIINKNVRIEKLYEDLSASIDYAKNIQQAILPTTEQITQLLPNSFVLFKPRDVVSGDFYYLEEVNNKIILAAIDCTGHGVPGAFMSLIGNDLLTEIVRNQQITQAHKILDRLHVGVSQLLRQKETQNHDGMDMALIVIDRTNQVLEFAGAKNPLVYIQANQLNVIKGDKVPIGGEQRESSRIFTSHRISLDQPTTFYLFSDGFQDQFGGPNNKKFSPGRLRNLLLGIHSQPFTTQKLTLAQTLQDWQAQGQEEQIDDVLLIGVQL